MATHTYTQTDREIDIDAFKRIIKIDSSPIPDETGKMDKFPVPSKQLTLYRKMYLIFTANVS